jgi:methionine synthase II (cobalamin-independent)
VAGFAHADQTLEEQRRIRDQIERLARRRVDVSTTCGLGRCSPEDATAAIRRIVELTAD